MHILYYACSVELCANRQARELPYNTASDGRAGVQRWRAGVEPVVADEKKNCIRLQRTASGGRGSSCSDVRVLYDDANSVYDIILYTYQHTAVSVEGRVAGAMLPLQATAAAAASSIRDAAACIVKATAVAGCALQGLLHKILHQADGRARTSVHSSGSSPPTDVLRAPPVADRPLFGGKHITRRFRRRA